MNSRDIRRKYGQNYLKDPAILFEMSEAISPNAFDNFIEIGPGHGALTNQMNRENIDIIGIDIDSSNIEFLKKEFNGPANFKFINEENFHTLCTNIRIDRNRFWQRKPAQMD